MPLYVVTVNNHQTIVRARTERAAAREAIEGFVTVSVRLASPKDVDWQKSMGGAVPEGGRRRAKR